MTFKEFVEKYNKGRWDFDGYYGPQCVDLFRFYIRDVLNLSQPKGVQGAKDFWANYDTDQILKKNFKQIENTPSAIPEEGDVVIWSGKVGGGFGHIAMAIRGNINTFVSLDQNWKGQGNTDEVTHDYKNIYGWFRPLPSPPQPPSGTLSPSQALPAYWYGISEAEEAIKRGLIKEKDAWDTVLGKFIENDKELIKQKAWFDEETEKLIAQYKEELEERGLRCDQNIRGLEIQLDSCLKSKEVEDMTATFPDWRKAWTEARRVFAYTAIVQLGIIASSEDLITRFNSLEDVLKFIVIPVLVGGLTGVIKYLRERIGQGDYDKLIYKI
jgi:hypothetical protein